MSTVDIDRQLSRLIIENQSEDGNIDRSDLWSMKEEILELFATKKATLKAELLAKIDNMYEHSIPDIELIEHQTGEEPAIVLKADITKIIKDM